MLSHFSTAQSFYLILHFGKTTMKIHEKQTEIFSTTLLGKKHENSFIGKLRFQLHFLRFIMHFCASLVLNGECSKEQKGQALNFKISVC